MHVSLVKLALEVSHIIIIFLHFSDSDLLLAGHGISCPVVWATRRRRRGRANGELVWSLGSSDRCEVWSAKTARTMQRALLFSITRSRAIVVIADPHERERVAQGIFIVLFSKVVLVVNLITREVVVMARLSRSHNQLLDGVTSMLSPGASSMFMILSK